MFGKLTKAAMAGGIMAAAVFMPNTANAAVSGAAGSQCGTIYPTSGGGSAYVCKSWVNPDSAGRYDGDWSGDPTSGVHIRVFFEGVEQTHLRTPAGSYSWGSYQNVKKFALKACNTSTCSALW
ncbi:hypothetical protein KQY30_16845 [Streptomyces sp. GMY02]|uniref:hypothetical protein n=1 Tax=Streptomyces sp. GMY02 TaxID=1333528 RepID=UPI001C2BF780|nr:hypothetical protein [Streptomyces sp. GMY02]QXE35679.1 hypothetical protein KQY30_16845 [Streptomyces sp. GMY02]